MLFLFPNIESVCASMDFWNIKLKQSYNLNYFVKKCFNKKIITAI